MVFKKKDHDIITAVYYFPPGFSFSLSGSKAVVFSSKVEVMVGMEGCWQVVNEWKNLWRVGLRVEGLRWRGAVWCSEYPVGFKVTQGGSQKCPPSLTVDLS